MKITDKKAGLTLIELLVTVAIAAILILTTAAILLITYRSWNTNNAYVRLRRDAAFAINIMARDIHESKSVDISRPNNDQLVLLANDVRTYTATYTRIGSNNVLRCNRVGTPTESFVLATGVAAPPFPDIPDNGIRIMLVMENDNFDISITNETFIHKRIP